MPGRKTATSKRRTNNYAHTALAATASEMPSRRRSSWGCSSLSVAGAGRARTSLQPIASHFSRTGSATHPRANGSGEPMTKFASGKRNVRRAGRADENEKLLSNCRVRYSRIAEYRLPIPVRAGKARPGFLRIPDGCSYSQNCEPFYILPGNPSFEGRRSKPRRRTMTLPPRGASFSQTARAATDTP